MFRIEPTHRAPLPTSQCLVGMLDIFVGTEEPPVSRGEEATVGGVISFYSGLCAFTCVSSLCGGMHMCLYVCVRRPEVPHSSPLLFSLRWGLSVKPRACQSEASHQPACPVCFLREVGAVGSSRACVLAFTWAWESELWSSACTARALTTD